MQTSNKCPLRLTALALLVVTLVAVMSKAVQTLQRATTTQTPHWTTALAFRKMSAGGVAVVVLAGQLEAWQQLSGMVLGDFSNPSVGFFFMITGIHGLHMAGGMVALARAIAKAFGQSDVQAMEHNVSNCALYWHYLLGVWLVVFGLLFSGNNFEILLRICGFI